MSRVAKYLEKAYVPKKVDPAVSDPNKPSVSNPGTNMPADIAPTPHRALIDDVLATAAETKIIIQRVINDIRETNKLDANFVKYAELAAKTFFDMNQLLSDQNARPTEPDRMLGDLEKDVYRRLVDPRAPFLRDLYRMMTDTTLTEFMMKRVWNKAANLPEDSDNRLSRLSLYKEKQQLKSTQRQAESIEELRPAHISTWDVKSLSDNLLQSMNATVGEARAIEEAIQAARSLQQLMQMQTLSSITTWEKFSDILANLFFDPISLAGARMEREIHYPFFQKIRKQVLGVVSLVHLLPDGGILPGMAEMKDQAESALLTMLRNMEDDLLTKERRMIEIEEARLILLLNVYKVSHSKSLTHLLGAVVSCLEGFGGQTKPVNTDTSVEHASQSPVSAALDTLAKTWPEQLPKMVAIAPGLNFYENQV